MPTVTAVYTSGDVTIGHQRADLLVRPQHLKGHLSLLHAFQSKGSAAGVSVSVSSGLGNVEQTHPPIDVVMVWHMYLLNPMYEHTRLKYPPSHIVWTSFIIFAPLAEGSQRDLLIFSLQRIRSWEKNTNTIQSSGRNRSSSVQRCPVPKLRELDNSAVSCAEWETIKKGLLGLYKFANDGVKNVGEGPEAFIAPSETDSLLARNGHRKISANFHLFAYSAVALLAIMFIGFSMIMHFTNCPLYPWTMRDIRMGWQNEVEAHWLLHKNWTMQEHEHALLEESWKDEAQWHEKEKERKEREEEQHQERVRKVWEEESERRKQALEKDIERRKHEEEQHQEQVRKAWETEADKHRQELQERNRRETEQMDSQRRKWQREIDEHDRLAEERRKHEEEERQKLNMFWGHVEAHQCTTYATREYTAVLMNLPVTWEHRVEACKATALEVHGISYLPKSCEDKGPGVVLGRWEINQSQPACTTFWTSYKDKASLIETGLTLVIAYLLLLQGCTSQKSGKRRIEQYMDNLPNGGDWKEFCATTPADFLNMHFIGAQECYQIKLRTYGQWEIDDSNC
ncbi:hypothetical protein PAXINDRAFT_100877 [Paxillus involutus ATCC 200175]|uniref:Uncharacterized protein n=1 Tax=Paxillus involutus ATCC 200175 TaxID=664439 RepID=A0A0C9TZS2_PAXIN|nr:hypothetical protein PAXINDRAFT_100877 [Paxillus involutus ATCC 200175]